jgi:hypothetical protein
VVGLNYERTSSEHTFGKKLFVPVFYEISNSAGGDGCLKCKAVPVPCVDTVKKEAEIGYSEYS